MFSILIVIGLSLAFSATEAPRLDKYWGKENPKTYESLGGNYAAAVSEGFGQGYLHGYEEGRGDGYEMAKSAHEDGYREAVLEAVLVESNEDGYIIDFGGEVHEYLFTNDFIPKEVENYYNN